MSPTSTPPDQPRPSSTNLNQALAQVDAGQRGRGALWWALSGVVAGVVGLSLGQVVSEVVSVRETPLTSVISAISNLDPGDMAQATAEFVFALLKPLLLVVLALLLVLVFAVAGLLRRHAWWAALPIWALLGAGWFSLALLTTGPGVAQVLPPVASGVAWVIGQELFRPALRRLDAALDAEASSREASTREVSTAVAGTAAPGTAEPDGEEISTAVARRSVLLGLGAGVVVSVASGAGIWVLERSRRALSESRRLLRIPGVTRPLVPADASVGVEGVSPWMTPAAEFPPYGDSLLPPRTVEVSQWRLVIHGLVRNPMELTYDDLIARGLTEQWATLVRRDNPVGGDNLGNAWWSGVLASTLLDEAGVLGGADMVVQSSADGWRCATPLAAMYDGRRAMVAVAMNGEALPIEHGFPVRSVVPGYYTDTADCAVVVDWEVTSSRAIEETNDLTRRVQVKLGATVQVPAEGAQVPAGRTSIGGVAWQPQVGVQAVEVSIDGTSWRPAGVASSGVPCAWVQWALEVDLAPGEHQVRVRAINTRGEKQTSTPRDPMPTGAGGWHEVTFTVDDVASDS